MRFVYSAMLLLAISAMAWGQDVTYWIVHGVAEDDVLNIRSEPDPRSPILGAIPPGDDLVEVILVEEGWAQIAYENSDRGVGWVSTAYLEQAEPDEWLRSGLPVGLQCAGTEPFWGLNQADNALVVDAFWREPERETLAVSGLGRPHQSGWPAVVETEDGRAIAVFEPRQCSDGMSDLTYGWTVNLILRGDGPDGNPQVLEGCCRIPLPH